MGKSYLHLTNLEFKNKYFDYLTHKKKLKALENLSLVDSFQHKSHLSLLKICLKEDFLEEEEIGFIDHLLKKYEIDWRFWYTKNAFVKGEIAKRNAASAYSQQHYLKQLEFNFSKNLAAKASKLPSHIIQNAFTNQYRRGA